MTKILRTTQAPLNSMEVTKENNAAYQSWKNNHDAYFLDEHGNLVEVQSYDQKLQVNVIDLKNAKVDTKVYDTGIAFPALTSIVQKDKTYSIGIHETASTRYAGVGTPTGSNWKEVLETDQGDLSLYTGQATTAVFQFDAVADTGVVTSQSTTGKVLDLSQRLTDVEKTDYAMTSDGSYGFLMDGHLVILDNRNEVVTDVLLSRSVKDGQIFAVGNQFIVVAVEAERRYPEVYAAIYHADGSVIKGFHNISNITKVAEDEDFYAYNNLRIEDMMLYKDTVYVLAKTDMDYYIITYNIKTNISTKELLSIKEKNYDRFIYTNNGLKLFTADDDYFYLRDVQ